jgi:hypothetical protein
MLRSNIYTRSIEFRIQIPSTPYGQWPDKPAYTHSRNGHITAINL